MIPEFNTLNELEVHLMIKAPVLVTILIAGAEGNIEEKEIDWGAKLAHIRSEDTDSTLQHYYREVDKSFKDLLKMFLVTLPDGLEERNKKIISELKKINHIIPKLEKKIAAEFYKGLLSLSKQVAKSSGGIWGFGSISPDEQKYVNLEFIHPPK